MNPFSQPLGMDLSQQVGIDELGRPIYRLPTGQIVGQPMAAVLGGQGDVQSGIEAGRQYLRDLGLME